MNEKKIVYDLAIGHLSIKHQNEKYKQTFILFSRLLSRSEWWQGRLWGRWSIGGMDWLGWESLNGHLASIKLVLFLISKKC